VNLFVRIDGQTGPVTTPAARSGWFKANAFGWGGIEVPVNEPGTAKKPRRHRPLTLVRSLDGASPVLFDAQVKSTALGITLAADVLDARGILKPSLTYVLKGAKVAKYELAAVNGGADAVTERIELVYTGIQVQQDPSLAKYLDNLPVQ
jgi:type VI protein secretion system component Hcp